VGGWCRSGIGLLLVRGLAGPERDVWIKKY
jgi:hypothetical protein